MNKTLLIAALLTAGAGGAMFALSPTQAAQPNGEYADSFTLPSAEGENVTLKSYRGKTIVLEWNNPGCPFVQKHYNSGNMQKTQAAARDMGVVWITINSGAEGKQGYMTPAEARAFVADQGANVDHYLFDRNGTVGKAFEARTTPHMYIIDATGKMVYQGGIDDKATANPADIKTARNHVLAALNELDQGKPVSVASSRPYGCSVKYKG